MEFRIRYIAVAAAQFPLALIPIVWLVAGDYLRQIHSCQSGKPPCRCQCRGFVRAGGDASVLCALLAQDARQLAGVNIGDGYYVVGFEIIGQGLRAAKIAHGKRQVADY